MNKYRYLIELGSGADLHGESATKAAAKALQDAISHCCMCGTAELPQTPGTTRSTALDIRIGVPNAAAADRTAILAVLPQEYASVTLELTEGGLRVPGLCAPQFGAGRDILIANAAVTVYLVES